MLYIISRKQPRCVYCEMAKNLADKAGLEYTIVPVEDVMEFMQENGLKSVPAIFKDSISMNNYIGGSTEFQHYVYTVR
jgi:glutaredoxin